MPIKTLVFDALSVADPATPPTGYLKPTGANNGRIGATTPKSFTIATSAVNAIWYDDTLMSGNQVSSIVRLLVFSSSIGPCLVDGLSGNGVGLIQNATVLRKYNLVNGQLGTEILPSITRTPSVGEDLELRRNPSTNDYQILVNNVALVAAGASFNVASYNPLYAGVMSRGGNASQLTSSYVSSRTVDTITDPIVLGSAISVGLTGFTAPTAVTGGGMSATGLSYSAGTLTATWPALSESLAPTVALPATDLTITVTESGGSATITADANLPAGYAAITFMSVIDDPRYIGGNITLSDGWLAYYDNDQPEVGNIEIQADGRIIADNAGTFIMFLHKFGGDNSITQYNFTINEAGDVVNIGLTSPGLVSRGLVSRGLVRTGL